MNGQTAPHSSRRKILGADVKSIGAAIAMAVVGEIAQSAINRAVRGERDSNQPDQTQSALQKTASSTQSAVESVIPLKGASDIVRQVLEEVKPSIEDLVAAVVGTADATQHAAVSTVGYAAGNVDATAHSAEDLVQDSVDTVQRMPGAVAGAVPGLLQNGIAGLAQVVKEAVQTTPDQKEESGKKKKKKKKGKKKK